MSVAIFRDVIMTPGGVEKHSKQEWTFLTLKIVNITESKLFFEYNTKLTFSRSIDSFAALIVDAIVN